MLMGKLVRQGLELESRPGRSVSSTSENDPGTGRPLEDGGECDLVIGKVRDACGATVVGVDAVAIACSSEDGVFIMLD